MAFLRSDEAVGAYIAVRGRVIDLIREVPDEVCTRVVPLCPAWTVSALVSHMMGVNEDILAGRMEGVTTDAWTQAQVDRHAGESLRQLADGWEKSAIEFDVVLRNIPAPVNSQLVMDAVTHEHDLRHALGSSDARDTDAVHVALGWLLDMAETKQPGLGHTLSESGIEPFQLLRSLTGRRSMEQMAELGLPVPTIEKILHGTPLKPPAVAIESNR
jgi:uncharacterized protein (TIGR03083 family)